MKNSSKSEKKPSVVICEKCKHKWNYRGQAKERIRCPKCHSSKNEANKRIFGVWNPDKISKQSRGRQK